MKKRILEIFLAMKAVHSADTFFFFPVEMQEIHTIYVKRVSKSVVGKSWTLDPKWI